GPSPCLGPWARASAAQAMRPSVSAAARHHDLDSLDRCIGWIPQEMSLAASEERGRNRTVRNVSRREAGCAARLSPRATSFSDMAEQVGSSLHRRFTGLVWQEPARTNS